MTAFIDTDAVRAWVAKGRRGRGLGTVADKANECDEVILSLCDEVDRLREQDSDEDGPHESDGTAPEACSYCGDVWPCASGVPTCTGDPCTCANGIGCVNIPVDQW